MTKSRGAADRDPSYPGLCIPPGWQVGDLDCKDVPHRRFQVVPLDPQSSGDDVDGLYDLYPATLDSGR